jgi:maleate isomerase
VTTIGLSSSALSRFEPHNLVEAAQLLIHAKVDVIGWRGTSPSLLGFAADEELCAVITEKTGIPSTTSMLGLNKAIKLLGVKRLGLVTPYVDDVQAAIVKNYKGIGVDASAERHLGRTDNVKFAELGAETFDPMVKGIVEEGVDAIAVFCTNLAAAQYAERWGKEYGVPVLDSVTTVVWDALRICGVDTSQIRGWGRLMELDSL